MLWVPVSSLKKYRLHPFVMKAVNAYFKKGVMKKYTPKKSSKKAFKTYKSSKSSYGNKNQSWVKAPEFASKPKTYPVRRVENDYTMRLVKIDKDGTKYFEPVYKHVVAQSGK